MIKKLFVFIFCFNLSGFLNAAIAWVQDSTTVGVVSGTTGDVSISPTAGNALVVYVGQTGSAGRTYTVSDNVDGTTGWAQAVYNNPGRASGIWYKVNIPSGITTITVAASGTAGYQFAASEFSGMGTVITVDDSDSNNEAVGSDNHQASATGVSSSNEVIAAVAGVLTAAATECNAGTGYTEVINPSSATSRLFEWDILSAPSGEVGAWTSTGTDRIGVSSIALLSGNASGGSSPVPPKSNVIITDE